MIKKKIIAVIVLFALALALAACTVLQSGQGNEDEALYTGYYEYEEYEYEYEYEPEPQVVSIVISAVGDIMMHLTQIISAHDSATDTHDFNHVFDYVRPYFQNSDLSIGNLETTFGGRPYAGWPLFSAPDSVAEALKNAGFDVITTANNHVYDTFQRGLLRTIDVLEEYNLLFTGSRRDDTLPRYAMFEVQGVNIAVIAYTYSSSNAAGELFINGIRTAPSSRPLVNYFRYTHLDVDLENVRQTVNDARASGADIVVMFYHWGDEYILESNRYQRTIAQRTADEMYVDIIFGSHPHTLQETVYLTSALTGREVPVFYSLGNFVSNQRRETLPTTRNNRHTETGAIAQVTVEFDLDNREIISQTMSAIPTWVERHRVGGRYVFAIIPLDENLETNPTLGVSGNLERARRAWEYADEILRLN